MTFEEFVRDSAEKIIDLKRAHRKLLAQKHWLSYGAWLAEDINRFIKARHGRWEQEFRYYKEILTQGYSVEDISKMRMDEYEKFRKNCSLFKYYKPKSYQDIEKEHALKEESNGRSTSNRPKPSYYRSRQA